MFSRYYQTEYGVTQSIDEIMDGVNAMLERYYRFEVPLKPGAAELLEYRRYRESGLFRRPDGIERIVKHEGFLPPGSQETALSIAGTDPSGGAGIQADLKTMTMNGVFAMSAITALVAQNTTGVREIVEMTPEFLGQQMMSDWL